MRSKESFGATSEERRRVVNSPYKLMAANSLCFTIIASKFKGPFAAFTVENINMIMSDESDIGKGLPMMERK